MGIHFQAQMQRVRCHESPGKQAAQEDMINLAAVGRRPGAVHHPANAQVARISSSAVTE